MGRCVTYSGPNCKAARNSRAAAKNWYGSFAFTHSLSIASSSQPRLILSLRPRISAEIELLIEPVSPPAIGEVNHELDDAVVADRCSDIEQEQCPHVIRALVVKMRQRRD